MVIPPGGGVDEAGLFRVRAGGCAAWPLPPDDRCAAVARARVREAFRALLMPEDLVGDATTMVSELATNVFVHAFGGGSGAGGSVTALPELYLYRRSIQPQIVVKVFDAAPWLSALPRGPLRAGPDAENGRGLEIVDALTREHGGRWGAHRTRSRLSPAPASGKAAFFALPIPAGCPAFAITPPGLDCVQAACELEQALAARGLLRMHRCQAGNMAVLSVRAEITVWVRQDSFCVTMPAIGTARYPLSDLTEVAEVIVRCNEDLDLR